MTSQIYLRKGVVTLRVMIWPRCRRSRACVPHAHLGPRLHLNLAPIDDRPMPGEIGA